MRKVTTYSPVVPERTKRTRDWAPGLAFAVGAAAAAVVFFWMTTAGTLDPFERVTSDVGTDHFYEGQARALLDGRLEVPYEAIGDEGIKIGSRLYGYFGVAPAVLRLPFMLLIDDDYPNLTPLSFMASFAVEAWALWSILKFVRRRTGYADRISARLDHLTLAAFALTALAGSVFLFLSARPLVYEEAILWGNAFTLAAIGRVLAFLERPNARSVVGAGALTTLALGSRATVGIAALVALGIAALVYAWRVGHESGASGAGRDGRVEWIRRALPALLSAEHRATSVLVAVACAAPVVAFGALNYAKFGSLFSAPLHLNISIARFPDKAALYEAGVFRLVNIPTKLIQYLRPDGITRDDLFPWVTFAMPNARPVWLIGNPKFDNIEYLSSVTSTMPILFGLSVLGMVAAFRHRAAHALSDLRAPLLGGLVALLTVLAFVGMSHRHMADFLPWLLVGAAGGLAVVLPRWPVRRLGRVVATGGVVAVVLYSVWVNFALTLVFQRTAGWELKGEYASQFARFRYELDALLSGDPLPIERADVSPTEWAGKPGGLYTEAPCRATWWYDGAAWWLVDFSGGPEVYVFSAEFEARRPGTRVPLLARGAKGSGEVLGFEWTAPDRGRFTFDHWGEPLVTSEEIDLAADERHEVVAWVDPGRQRVKVTLDRGLVLDAGAVVGTIDPAQEAVGDNAIGADVAPTFAGDLQLVEEPAAARPEASCGALSR